MTDKETEWDTERKQIIDNLPKKNLRFSTEYYSNGRVYSSEVYAKSIEDAQILLRDKKLTERIVSYDPDTKYLDIYDFS